MDHLAPAPTDDLSNKNSHVVMLAALACIQRECETALSHPEVSFTSICRIAALARQAVAPPPPPPSGVRPRIDTQRRPSVAAAAYRVSGATAWRTFGRSR